MHRIHIIGGKNHGKTTLVEELVAELTARGLRVGTIKHTHHHHELDVPGKDSHRHRAAGAAVVGILTRSLNAIFWNPNVAPGNAALSGDARYEQFVAAFADCRLVIVEGDTQTNAPKLEVWRAACGTPPLAMSLNDVVAVITDDPLAGCGRTLPRSDVIRLADELLSRW
ncbi:MAG: molybdopterin-guanine dinucleotide biosynthesis protein B [Pirellulales bacterium]